MKIHYVSGSRADFGLMKRALVTLDASPGFDVGIVATAQHMVAHYGNTLAEIADSGLAIAHEIPVTLTGQSGAQMAEAMAIELGAMVRFWQDERPDLVLLLGDRGEMLAGALAALHLGIPVGHIGGGELSGTLDESFRHAITKLSHLHFPTTLAARNRLIRMGERPETIHCIGAPGLVGIERARDGDWLRERYGFEQDARVALVVFHPVVQEAGSAGEQVDELLRAVRDAGFARIMLRPNSDAGGAEIDEVLDQHGRSDRAVLVTHLEREDYLRTLASVDLVIGNSSSGIIESASFGVPCVNIGSRQNGRERNRNTIDCNNVSADRIGEAIAAAMSLELARENVYGDGQTHMRLLELLKTTQLTPELLSKRNAY